MANKPNMTSTTFSLTLGGRESSLSRSLPFIPFTFSWIVLIGFSILAILSFHCTDVPVLHNGETFNGKTIRVIIGACGVHQPAYGDKTSLRHVALSEYHLTCVGLGLIRVVIKVTDHAVHLQRLVDVSRNKSVIKPFSAKSW